MSALREFVSNQRKDGTKIRSCIIATDNSYLKTGLSLCGLLENRDYTITHYDTEMPEDMQTLFHGIRPEIRHIYCLFDGPFEQQALRTIKQYSLDDPEVMALMEKQNAEMEDYPEPVTI